jgi:pimeloyl-ACP methyl ester carboxylesterase
MASTIAAALLVFGAITAAGSAGADPGTYAEVNGLKVYYEIHGQGRPLVLLHGAFGTAEGWAHVLPSLTKTRQVILIEQQGHGHTPDRDAPLTYEQMAEDTAALLERIGVKGADIFGYSDGGVVGLRLAMKHPELVGKLAVLGSNAGKLSDTYEQASYEMFLALPDDFAPAVIKDPYDRVAPDKSKWPVLVRKIKDLGRDFPGFPAGEVKAIKAPTLVMQGDRDGVRPEHAVEIMRMIPGARLAIFPGADHFLLYTNPDLVVETFMGFFDAPATEGGH